MSKPSVSPRTLYHLVIFQSSQSFISSKLLRECRAMLDNKITTAPEDTDIDIWIDSPGGSAHSAYKLILDLRHRCTNLRAVVPDFAKSAATLMMLGVDRVYMGTAAELGPLDVQMIHPDREREYVSGLDIANSLEYMGGAAMLMTFRYTDFLVEATDLPRLEVLKAALAFTARFMQPIVAKLDPHKLHQASNLLDVAGEYGLRLLASRNVPATYKLSKDDSKTLIEKLSKLYKSHGFVISCDEATELGLPIVPIEEYPRWAAVQKMWTMYLENNVLLHRSFPIPISMIHNRTHLLTISRHKEIPMTQNRITRATERLNRDLSLRQDPRMARALERLSSNMGLPQLDPAKEARIREMWERAVKKNP